MYCPKCGGEAVEEQRYCKFCGTNLQLINNAIKSGGRGPGPFNFDAEEIKRNINEFATSWKSGWAHYEKGKPYRQSARELRRRTREEVKRRNLPLPNQWLHYSRQHNFKEGLTGMLGGIGGSYAFFKIGEAVLNSGVIHEIPRITDPQIHGLEVLARIFWLFLLIPALKGLGQVIYATFFAESMSTLSERFTIAPEQLAAGESDTDRVVERNTAPQAAPANVGARVDTREFDHLSAAPASVTENTTQFFEDARPQARRESN